MKESRTRAARASRRAASSVFPRTRAASAAVFRQRNHVAVAVTAFGVSCASPGKRGPRSYQSPSP